jgi:hypothetical protein
MALELKDSRRAGRRAFQPTLDGTLESRVLLSATQIRAQTAAGGAAVVITSTTGQQFYVSVTQGTLRATPASGGRVNLVARGTTSSTYLEINQIIVGHGPNSAHTFNPTPGNATGILNVASIDIVSGFINSIEGYRDAVLSGPITVAGTSAVSRIAFTAINEGGSIDVGGSLETLDVLNNATLSTPTGISVGLDLDWVEIGENLTVETGSQITVGRDTGAVAQVAKGSGNAGEGIFVNGNVALQGTGKFNITRNLDYAGILVNGNFSGASNFAVGGVINGPINVIGTVSA